MSVPIKLRGITRAEMLEYIRANVDDTGTVVIQGITFEAKEDSTIYVYYQKVKGFLMTHERDFGDLYINNSYDLKDSADQFRDMKFLADVFGVDLVEGKTIPKSDTPVFDDRDLTIARLESQIEVYKSMMPSTNKVTYEKEKINE
jgi:hypothetical protein